MTAHYGVAVVPTAHKNALNAIYAVWKNEDPTSSENLSQPSNQNGSTTDPITHWFGGRLYSDADLVVIQSFAANLPAASWPIMGVSGSVTQAQALAAAAAMIVHVTTQEVYTSQQAQATLSAVMQALGLQRVWFDE